jgi:hypothetical protein
MVVFNQCFEVLLNYRENVLWVVKVLAQTLINTTQSKIVTTLFMN